MTPPTSRTADKQRTKPHYPVIDADGHITETPALYEAWAASMPPEHRSAAPRLYTADGTAHWIVESKIWPAYKDRDHGQGKPQKPAHMWVHREGEHDPEARIPDMDVMGIDTSVLFCTNMIGVPAIVEDPGLAAAISRVYNDWLAGYCASSPERLKGVAMVPLQDPPAAAAELGRAVGMGMVGALFVPAYGTEGDKMLDHEDFYPIYEAAQELDVPICIHNAMAIGPTRHLWNNFVLRHSFGTFPLQMAMGALMIGGVLDAFPRLRVAFLEAGAGWVPYIMERLQARYELLPHWVTHLKRTPEEYIRGEQLFFSMEPDEETAPMVARIIGDDRLILGSDYAHWDGSAPESMWIVVERDDLTADQKRRILSDNPASLYRL